MHGHQLKEVNIVETNEQWLARRDKAVAKGVAHATPIFADHAQNAEVWDVEGNRYIDFAGGIAVLNTGHGHPLVNKAVEAQLQKFSHTAFQVMPYKPYIELAERLNDLAPISGEVKSVLFSTGAEAVENAVKIARSHTGRAGVISFVGGFHGRSLLTLGLTGKVDPYKKSFGPFPGSIYHLPFPMAAHDVSTDDSLSVLNKLFKADIEPEAVAAIVLEPVQGEGGFYAAPQALMTALRKICDQHGIVLIADEVQCGIGRTGKLFAMEHYDVQADLITTAKSLAAGYPLSGIIGRADIMDAPQPGGLGGTYGGNPVACAAALAVLNVIEEENLLDQSTLIGSKLVNRINTLKSQRFATRIGDVRTLGAMTAFELIDENGQPDPAAARTLTQVALKKGLVLLSCGIFGNVIRILVPLTVSESVLDEGIDIIAASLAKLDG